MEFFAGADRQGGRSPGWRTCCNNPFLRVPTPRRSTILAKSGKTFEFPVDWGIDLQSEHERFLTEKHFKSPVILYDYPRTIKPFYMRVNDDGKTVRAMDVLVPGVGEIIGGSQREERLDVLEGRMKEQGLDPEAYWWYLDLRRYGTVPHAGLRPGPGADAAVPHRHGQHPRRDGHQDAPCVEKPRFPVIDVHNHLGGGKQTLTPERVRRLPDRDERGRRATVVNLDGGWGDRLKETLAALDEAHPGRFLTFALIDFDGIDDDDWCERETKRLEESFQAGAKGLKFHKTLGLRYRYKDGKLMPVDDPKLDPIWEMCAQAQEAGHDPHRRPGRVLHAARPLQRALARAERASRLAVLRRAVSQARRSCSTSSTASSRSIRRRRSSAPTSATTPKTWRRWPSKLDKYPNMYVDIDARISELGRQPYTARKFFLKYQDRIMFGTDTTPRREAFRIYYRFLETDDEYFDCAASHHLQGFWMIYGIYLPKEVLEKVYRKNAERVLLGLKPRR